MLIKLELILESKFAIEISSYRRKQYDNDTDGQKMLNQLEFLRRETDDGRTECKSSS